MLAAPLALGWQFSLLLISMCLSFGYLSFNLTCTSPMNHLPQCPHFYHCCPLLPTVKVLFMCTVLFLFLSSSGPEPLPRSLRLMLATGSHSWHCLWACGILKLLDLFWDQMSSASLGYHFVLSTASALDNNHEQVCSPLLVSIFSICKMV